MNLCYEKCKSRIVEVTKEFTFDSSHSLKEYVGKCFNLHGHTYKLQVSVKGRLNDTGMVIDFALLKDIVKKKVVDVLDHHHLNDIFGFNITAENLVLWIADSIEPDIKELGCEVSSVKLWETPTSYAEVRR